MPEAFTLPPEQCIDLGSPPGRLTLQQVELICMVLRKHHKVEIHCGFDPYMSDLFPFIVERTVEKAKD